MNIVQVRQKFPLDGGTEVHIWEISKRMVKRGHKVTVYTSNIDLYWKASYTRRIENIDGIEVIRFQPIFKVFRNLVIPSMLPSLMKAKADVIHAHGHFYNTTELSAIACTLKKKPFVLTPHFQPYYCYTDPLERSARKAYRVVAKMIFDAAWKIIAVSPWTKGYLVEIFGVDPEKIVVIPNGIDLSRVRRHPKSDDFRRKLGISGKLILYVGHISQRKGADLLVRAAPAVLKDFTDSQFVFIGADRGLKIRLERLAEESGIKERIHFLGFLQEEELLKAYSSADLFVLPSRFEAFGITLLEAMACGTPIVATRTGGIPYVVKDGENALLVEPNNPAQLAEAMVRMLSDEKLRKRAVEKGYERVKMFDWETITERVLKLYSELIRTSFK